MPQLIARELLETPPAERHGGVVLSYDERLLRRKRLVTEEGFGFLVDLPSVTNLDDYWGFRLEDGRAVEVVAAVEELVEVTGPQLLRYAWHIGNRHTPCQIEAARLLIRTDHVLENMLLGLGATVTRVAEPFRPEGGAYGHGRTMGHSHGPGGHSHEEFGALTGNAADEASPLSGPEKTAAKPQGTSPAELAQVSPAPHAHGPSCGCADHGAKGPQPAPAFQAWSPVEAETPEQHGFGWHHHGDDKMHYHAPPRPVIDDPLGAALGLRPKGK